MSEGSPEPSYSLYRSKRDGWLMAALASAHVLAAAALVEVWRSPAALASKLAVAVVVAASAGLTLWVVLGTAYRLGPAALEVRAGPFRWRVPYGDIVVVRPSRNPLAAPALSFDRLLIERRDGRALLVSPADRDGFAAALEDRRHPA
jgi:hypothetical protein